MPHNGLNQLDVNARRCQKAAGGMPESVEVSISAINDVFNTGIGKVSLQHFSRLARNVENFYRRHFTAQEARQCVSGIRTKRKPIFLPVL
ncbi:MAG: hypothetical protein A2Y13_12435 [Planctomycetes bacterium GWC2_45_44]|nr:MAG: hypothetical protein A2Y13_12435 [Planctomycetes bacterium GWC2_45_44]